MLTSVGPLTLIRDAQNGRVTGASVGIVAGTLGYDAFGAIEQRAVTAGGTALLSMMYVRDALGRTHQTPPSRGMKAVSTSALASSVSGSLRGRSEAQEGCRVPWFFDS